MTFQSEGNQEASEVHDNKINGLTQTCREVIQERRSAVVECQQFPGGRTDSRIS